MIRLKNCILQMENNTKTFKEIYEGKEVIPGGTPGNPTEFPIIESDPTFWFSDISMTIEMTNKASLDRPTLLFAIPAEKLGIDTYSVAIADYCYRSLKPYIDELNSNVFNRNKPKNETGWYYLTELGGEIFVRNTSFFEMKSSKDYVNKNGFNIIHYENTEKCVQKMCFCFRMQVQLVHKKPKKIVDMLCNTLPSAIISYVKEFDKKKVLDVINLSNKQTEIRDWLKNSNYCAFIANDSILPRDSQTGGPIQNAIPFKAPEGEEIDVCGIKGLGIKKGVTVITGGGYSGKSTILNTISAGIYNHVLGDGRELCITDHSAMTISAEDGRCIKNIDISAFIKWVPGGNPSNFSTEHASGSTSQAANILEAVDTGSKLLLIDEDQSATNFMIRDEMMKELICREPITPFTERVNELFSSCGVSTILVIGGSGEYLSVADNIYLMDEYLIYNVTKKAKKINPKKNIDVTKVMSWNQPRKLLVNGFTSYPEGKSQEKLAVNDVGYIYIGDEKIDTKGIHDILCTEQRTAMGFMLRMLENKYNNPYDKYPADKTLNLTELVEELYTMIEENGLDSIYYGNFNECERNLALPRKCDFLALIYRLRHTNYIITK